MRYQAISVNPEFEGRTCGVKFEAGEALFDDLTIAKKNLGLSAAEVADRLEKDFGYTVIKLNNDGSPYVEKHEPVSVESGAVDFEIPAA